MSIDTNLMSFNVSFCFELLFHLFLQFEFMLFKVWFNLFNISNNNTMNSNNNSILNNNSTNNSMSNTNTI